MKQNKKKYAALENKDNQSISETAKKPFIHKLFSVTHQQTARQWLTYLK